MALIDLGPLVDKLDPLARIEDLLVQILAALTPNPTTHQQTELSSEDLEKIRAAFPVLGSPPPSIREQGIGYAIPAALTGAVPETPSVPPCAQTYSPGPDAPPETCGLPHGHAGGCDWPSAGLRGKR